MSKTILQDILSDKETKMEKSELVAKIEEIEKTRNLAIFEKQCLELDIDYFVENVKKVDPSTKKTIWRQIVAFPKTTVGYTTLMGETRSCSFLHDKTKIWLRSQNDPRRAISEVTIAGVKMSKDDILSALNELAQLKAEKAAKMETSEQTEDLEDSE